MKLAVLSGTGTQRSLKVYEATREATQKFERVANDPEIRIACTREVANMIPAKPIAKQADPDKDLFVHVLAPTAAAGAAYPARLLKTGHSDVKELLSIFEQANVNLPFAVVLSSAKLGLVLYDENASPLKIGARVEKVVTGLLKLVEDKLIPKKYRAAVDIFCFLADQGGKIALAIDKPNKV